MDYNTCYSLRIKHLSSKEEWSRLVDELNNRRLIGYAFVPGEYDPEEEILIPPGNVTGMSMTRTFPRLPSCFPAQFSSCTAPGKDMKISGLPTIKGTILRPATPTSSSRLPSPYHGEGKEPAK